MAAPSHTVPKSGCRPVPGDMWAMYAAESGSSGSLSTGVFQALSAGNSRNGMGAPMP